MSAILNAITNQDLTGNIILQLTTEQLKEVVGHLYNEIQANVRRQIEAEREMPTLTTEQVREMLNVGATTLYRWHKSGILVPVKIGASVRYRRSDVEEILGARDSADPSAFLHQKHRDGVQRELRRRRV